MITQVDKIKYIVMTWTLEPLIKQAIQQGAAVVTESGAGVGVGAELVSRSLYLQ